MSASTIVQLPPNFASGRVTRKVPSPLQVIVRGPTTQRWSRLPSTSPAGTRRAVHPGGAASSTGSGAGASPDPPPPHARAATSPTAPTALLPTPISPPPQTRTPADEVRGGAWTASLAAQLHCAATL